MILFDNVEQYGDLSRRNWQIRTTLKYALLHEGFVICECGDLTGLFVQCSDGTRSQASHFGAITCTELRVIDEAGLTQALLSCGDKGGSIGVTGKDGQGMVVITINKHGGYVNCISNKDSSGTAGIGIDKQGHGTFVVLDAEGLPGASMGCDEHGGAVTIWGKGNERARVGIGVNEYGNGAVSAWDKNGYRLATLK